MDPLLTSTFPLVPGLKDVIADVPLPIRTALAVCVVAPVPPLATGKVPVIADVRSTPDKVPPSVRLPEEVTVPVSVSPMTVPVPPTDVTVPSPTSTN